MGRNPLGDVEELRPAWIKPREGPGDRILDKASGRKIWPRSNGGGIIGSYKMWMGPWPKRKLVFGEHGRVRGGIRGLLELAPNID